VCGLPTFRYTHASLLSRPGDRTSGRSRRGSGTPDPIFTLAPYVHVMADRGDVAFLDPSLGVGRAMVAHAREAEVTSRA
jgi:hypothetical protein